MTRDNDWLELKLEDSIRRYFPDITFHNQLWIRFGRQSRRQLGCIKNNHPDKINQHDSHKPTTITINGLFKNSDIPEFVVEGTIIHELCHYAHGFSSPLKQLFRHPHQGGKIKEEMTSRGAGKIYKDEKEWLKNNWQNYLNKYQLKPRRRTRRGRFIILSQ